jgi:myo-inositol-1(or 4)-monophosphatase
MKDHFFNDVEESLVNTFQKLRPELLRAHGNVEFINKPNNEGPVTELDKRVEEIIRKELQRLDRGIGLKGEELGVEGSTNTYWTIDPIDGTRAFIRGLPFCSNMISLVNNGRVEYALVYQFVVDKLYTARLHQGAYLNGNKIRLQGRPFEQCWVISHASLETHSVLLTKLAKKVERVVTSGSIMAVADGAYDAYMSSPDGTRGDIWDYAPRALIYAEAGALVSNIGSSSYDPCVRTLLAAHPNNFDKLHRIILSV